MNKAPENSLRIGTVLNDKWVILEFIAKGGMGEVYRAHQLNLKRDVAIKIISREWLKSLEDNEEEMEIGLQRFRNEVQAMAQVRHSNVLQIYDYGSFSIKKDEEDLSMEYIAMEYVPGGTLWSTMSDDGFYPEKDLTVDWLLKNFLPVLEGSHTLHEANIIHRDLKPGNVLMDGKTPKIADFGLARSSRMRPVTKSIDVKGTPAYMSPEHFMDLRRTDQRSDIYSLGKILFEAIDGKMSSEIIPFKCASLPHPENPFFKKLDQIIQKATAEDRNFRFDSVGEFRDAILEAIGTETLKKPQEVSTSSRHFSFLSQPKWIWSGIALTTISVLLMTLWHLLGEPGRSSLQTQGTPSTFHETGRTEPTITSSAILAPAASPESALISKDGVILHLIPGGDAILPDKFGQRTGKSVRVDSFYMDETEVTNHQYVEFLNKVLPEISVNRGIVNGNGHIWMMMGEVIAGYEPIIYRDGRFFIKNPGYHSHPVVRVTPYGAVAYAHFYGKRLPNEVEWLRATGAEDKMPERSSGLSPESSGTAMHMEMMHWKTQSDPSNQQEKATLPLPVTHFKPNKNGIRGLNGNVLEWVISLRKDSSQGKGTIQYVFMPETISRHPWEAFEEVGFRTVLTVPGHEKQNEEK
ncbi:MAG: protein kinase [Deltaproteobacteria bacterium]|nr:protein kinase [Deltaproteobacteria bacterium]MBW2119572.1 protein kinase [Deltaproteobacteria bacterium]MBW2343362.1 protein kinase [Deltaproteobacteria bacterium]